MPAFTPVRIERKFPVAIAAESHPFPFRTRKLSPPAPMVLGRRLPGRVGRRRNALGTRPPGDVRGLRRVWEASPTAMGFNTRRCSQQPAPVKGGSRVEPQRRPVACSHAQVSWSKTPGCRGHQARCGEETRPGGLTRRATSAARHRCSLLRRTTRAGPKGWAWRSTRGSLARVSGEPDVARPVRVVGLERKGVGQLARASPVASY